MSAVSSETAFLVGSNAVTSALAQAIAQQLNVSAKEFNIVVTTSSDDSGVQIAYAIQPSQQSRRR